MLPDWSRNALLTCLSCEIQPRPSGVCVCVWHWSWGCSKVEFNYIHSVFNQTFARVRAWRACYGLMRRDAVGEVLHDHTHVYLTAYRDIWTLAHTWNWSHACVDLDLFYCRLVGALDTSRHLWFVYINTGKWISIIMAVIQLVMLHNAFRCNLPDHYTNETEIGKEGERDIGLYIKQTVFTV